MGSQLIAKIVKLRHMSSELRDEDNVTGNTG